MPVGELLARCSSRELTEWMAYEREHGPIGPERGDWQAANVAYTTAVMLAGKKGRKLKMRDFLLRWGGRKRHTPEEMLNAFRALAARQDAVAAAQAEEKHDDDR